MHDHARHDHTRHGHAHHGHVHHGHVHRAPSGHEGERRVFWVLLLTAGFMAIEAVASSVPAEMRENGCIFGNHESMGCNFAQAALQLCNGTALSACNQGQKKG